MRLSLLVSATFALVATARAQDTPAEKIVAALKAGKLVEATALAERGGTISPASLRIDVATQMIDTAARAQSGTAGEREDALLSVLRMLESKVIADLRRARNLQRHRAGVAAARLLVKGSEVDEERRKDHVFALEQALEALNSMGQRTTRQVAEVKLQLMEVHALDERHGKVRELCRQTLGCPLEPEEKERVRVLYGFALLGGQRVSDALPYLQTHLAKAPSDPAHVYPVASRVPLDYADPLFDALLPVVQRDAGKGNRDIWAQCLGRIYACAVERKGKAKGSVRALFARNRVLKPMPQRWPGASWEPGFRRWIPDGAGRGKQYQGKHTISAVMPTSAGWATSERAPADLRRWGNTEFAFERGRGGAAFVVNLFGPDVYYWYGREHRHVGVTEKKVRGSTRGGIIRLVGDVAYGIDAKHNKVRYAKATPVPFKMPIRGTVRRAWRRGGVHYDHTFFSIGQVTCEIVLRVTLSDLELLEPELRWLFANVRTQ